VNPLVSVLVNTFNYGRYVVEAVESILRQDFPSEQLEVIVVDDGSTDDTADRLKRFGSTIRYIYQQNQGHAQACNTGFAASRGEYICLLDSDDLWYPEKLRYVVEEFRSNPQVHVVFHCLDVVSEDGTHIGVTPMNVSSEPIVRLTPEEFLYSFHRMVAPTSGVSIRRQAMERVLPIPTSPSMRVWADAYLHRAMVLHSPRFSLIRRPLGIYRRHGKSHSFGLTMADKARRHLEQNRFVAKNLLAKLSTTPGTAPFFESFLTYDVEEMELMVLNIEGRKLKALMKAIKLQPFPPRATLLGMVEAKLALVLSAVLPQRLFYFLKGWYREVRSFQPIQSTNRP
jgi:glycosyltransferase involved in cell wall biosynthesis